jgi:hypothetical protein
MSKNSTVVGIAAEAGLIVVTAVVASIALHGAKKIYKTGLALKTAKFSK